jgi:endonuclease/exonuclease/phosphatase family metal-dependent hydrolase
VKVEPEENQRLVEELSLFTTFAELRRSDAYRSRAAELHRLLDEPRTYEFSSPQPRLHAFLRVVEWNIQRGTHVEAIIDVLNTHPILRFADLLLLNELDDGMLRSGNRNVPRELSQGIGAHAIYGVEYLEMTKGIGDELKLEGRNTAALHGNAILTRHSFSNPRTVRLPRCEKNYESPEKRVGGRVGLLVEVEIRGSTLSSLLAVTAHLDVVNTPSCRDRQMRALLDHIDLQESRGSNQGIVIGADLNSHTFARGGWLRSSRSAIRILTTRQERLAHELLHPETREPAIGQLKKHGYEVAALNDRRATSRAIVSTGSDANWVPGPLRRWVLRRIDPSALLLEFRLDWLASRGLKALGASEKVDHETGVRSIAPQTCPGLIHEGAPISDHDPIVADLAL